MRLSEWKAWVASASYPPRAEGTWQFYVDHPAPFDHLCEGEGDERLAYLDGAPCGMAQDRRGDLVFCVGAVWRDSVSGKLLKSYGVFRNAYAVVDEAVEQWEAVEDERVLD